MPHKYRIKRIDPNSGQVWEIGPFGEEIQTTETLPYTDCKIFLLKNQVELRVYKIGCIGSRKGAKRKYLKRIFATGIIQAMELFNQIVEDEAVTLQLCSGDWKVLAEKQPTGRTKFYFK